MTANVEAPRSLERRLFIFARHGESAANVERVVSSDPAHGAALTPRRRTQARRLGAQLANLVKAAGSASTSSRAATAMSNALPYLVDDNAVRRATQCLDALAPSAARLPIAGTR